MSGIDALVWSRALERLVAVTFCGVSLVLGWNLFRVGVITEQRAILDGHGWKFKLERVGPGVFFALFGVIGLVIAMRTPLTLGPRHLGTPDGQIASYIDDSSREESLDTVRAVNTISRLMVAKGDAQPRETKAVNDALAILTRNKQRIMTQLYPNLAWYESVHERAKAQPLVAQDLPPQSRALYYEIAGASEATLLEEQSEKGTR